MMRILLLFMASLCPAAVEGELIFPLQTLHNHSSSIVELANGDLFVCWYNGSGERTADDVKVMGARRKRGAKSWSEPVLLHDTPHFPDTNPILFFDSKSRLWLVWSTILANRWETALTRFKIASKDWSSGAPRWDVSDNMLFIPPNFEARVKEALAPKLVNRAPGRAVDEVKHAYDMAGDKYFSRLGWMARVHPLELPSGRILIPLYSDGYNFSLMGITDDGGKTWRASEPLVSEGGVQPSLVRRKDGTIVAYMRDNGPPPKRALLSQSRDDGITWSPVLDTEIPNPGSSLEIIALRSGSWLLIHNDTERGRHSLAAWLSDDEGATWKWKRPLELDTREKEAGSFSYPSVMQSRDGSIHVTYSFSRNDVPKGSPRQSIKHVQFPEAWLKQ
ncbi:MAG TPA: sialidase family protein [Bryobacteraceae bacterium]|nr:sialidase family protein [Bryobacteraceae bacterium]